MKLTLDPLDLKEEFQRKDAEGTSIDQACNTRDVDFEKLRTEVQEAIRAVGRATFYAWDRQTYNAIYPPKE